MAATDRNGDELKAGDHVTLDVKVIRTLPDSSEIEVELDPQIPGTFTKIRSRNVTRVGETDTAKAAREGYEKAMSEGAEENKAAPKAELGEPNKAEEKSDEPNAAQPHAQTGKKK